MGRSNVMAPRLRGFLCALIALGLLVSPAAAQADPSPLTMTYNVYKDAVVFIAVEYETQQGKGCEAGTGFLISSSGYVLTSRHLITDDQGKPYEKYSIAGSVGESFTCDRPRGIVRDLNYVRSEPEQDVMLLKVAADQVFNYVRACQQTKVEPGEKLYVLGFPLGQPLSGTEVTRGQTHGPMGRWQISGLLNPGGSGSPVLNASGRLVGLVFGGFNGANGYEFMVPLDHFKHLFGFASTALENCSTPTGPFIEAECVPKPVQHRIDWTLSDHKGLQTNSKGFRDRVAASNGKIIVSYEWEALSANGASGIDIDVSDDKKSLAISSQLTSGPIFDQWRGWVAGNLTVSEIPENCQ